MAQNFNEMTKEELSAVLNSDSIVNMNTVELNNLRKAAKVAGLLTVQYDNMLGIAINNRTYEEIKNSDKYTEEEKALALQARNEYNKELRTRTKNKLYNAEEIMSRAVESNGQYHFDELTKGEMDFLLENGIVRLNEFVIDNNASKKQYNAREIMSRAVEKDGKYHFDKLSPEEKKFLVENGIAQEDKLSVGKQYNIGQQENRDFSKEVTKDTSKLSADVKKSQEFWGKFNDNKSGIQYIVQALKDNRLKVEAQKENKTIFTGIDHGNKGFDIVKKEDTAEPYAIYDLIIKKAKTSNPKAKIRIKDNVQDPALRNKILIACAKNNMEPIGNVPEGFDFEALKDMVKDVKDIATINALAENLYDMSGIDVANENPEKENRAAAVVLPQNAQEVAPENKQEEKEGSTVVAPIPLFMGGQDKTQGAANISENNNGNIPPVQNQEPEKKVAESPKRPWWKKVRDTAVVAGIALLGMIGVRSCQNQEKLEKNIKDLQEQVDRKSIEDCDALSAKFAEEYAKGYADGKEDCEEQNKPKPAPQYTPAVKKKPVEKKTPVNTNLSDNDKQDENKNIVTVKTVTVPKFAPLQEDNKLSPVPEANPYDNLPKAPKIETESKTKSSVPLKAIDTSLGHEKDYDLNNALELDENGKLTADNNINVNKTDIKEFHRVKTANGVIIYNLDKNGTCDIQGNILWDKYENAVDVESRIITTKIQKDPTISINSDNRAEIRLAAINLIMENEVYSDLQSRIDSGEEILGAEKFMQNYEETLKSFNLARVNGKIIKLNPNADQGKTLNLSNPAVFNSVRNSINGNIH